MLTVEQLVRPRASDYDSMLSYCRYVLGACETENRNSPGRHRFRFPLGSYHSNLDKHENSDTNSTYLHETLFRWLLFGFSQLTYCIIRLTERLSIGYVLLEA